MDGDGIRQGETAPDQATERLRLWLGMLRAVRSVEGLLRERLRAEHGLTLPRFDVLATLYGRAEGLRMSELSSRLVVSNGNVTGIVDRLEAEGLLRRDAVEGDRRAQLVRLTEEGRILMDGVVANHLAWVDGAMSGVGEEEGATALAVMRLVRKGGRTGRGG